MQPAPAQNPFSNPTVTSLFVLGLILLIVGLVLFWPLLIIGILLMVFGLASPYMMGQPMAGGYYPQPAYPPYQQPYQYPAYQQPPYAPPMAAPQAPPPQPAPVIQPAPQPMPQPAPAYAPPAQPTTNCPRCGRPLTYVPQYQRWYCPAENVYPWG